jgi:hypothetical protein
MDLISRIDLLEAIVSICSISPSISKFMQTLYHGVCASERWSSAAQPKPSYGVAVAAKPSQKQW